MLDNKLSDLQNDEAAGDASPKKKVAIKKSQTSVHKSHDGALGKAEEGESSLSKSNTMAGAGLDDGGATKYKKHKSFMAGGSTTPSSVAKVNKVGKGSLLANFGKKKTSHFSVIDSGSKSPMGGSVGNKSVLVATTTSATKLGALSGSVGPRESKTP